MRVTLFAAALVVALTAATAASAQYGHPLKGTWSGDSGHEHRYAESPAPRTALGRKSDHRDTSTPGPNAVPLTKGVARCHELDRSTRSGRQGSVREGRALCRRRETGKRGLYANTNAERHLDAGRRQRAISS